MVSIVYRVLGHFEPKKSDKILEDVELYQVFMYKFLGQTILILPVHILCNANRIGTLWPKNSDKKVIKFKKIFELYQVLVCQNCLDTPIFHKTDAH